MTGDFVLVLTLHTGCSFPNRLTQC